MAGPHSTCSGLSAHKYGVLNRVAGQERIATNPRLQSAVFLIMSFEKYMRIVYPASMTIRDIVCVNGKLWYKSAKDGKKPYMRHHGIFTYFSTSQMEISSQRLSTAGHSYLSLLAIPSLMNVVGETTGFTIYSHSEIVYAASVFSRHDWRQIVLQRQWSSNTHT